MEELITAKELCNLLKVSKSWLSRAAKIGLIPHYRFGNLLRFSRTDVESYIEKRKREAQEKERRVSENKDDVHSSKIKRRTEDDPHSLEFHTQEESAKSVGKELVVKFNSLSMDSGEAVDRRVKTADSATG